MKRERHGRVRCSALLGIRRTVNDLGTIVRNPKIILAQGACGCDKQTMQNENSEVMVKANRNNYQVVLVQAGQILRTMSAFKK